MDVHNESILRDVLQKVRVRSSKTMKFCESSSTPTTSETKQFCEPAFKKSESWAQSWQPLWFFHSMCPKYWTCHEKVKPSHTKCCIVLHLSGKIILANRKIWCGQMQPLSGNQRQDRRTCLTHASLVIAPATRHASLPTLWKRPTPAIALQLQYKTDVWTSKSVRTCGVFGFFLHVDFESRFVPQQCALFRHLNFQKCSENDVF